MHSWLSCLPSPQVSSTTTHFQLISGYSFLLEMGEYRYKVSGRYKAYLKVLVLVMAQVITVLNDILSNQFSCLRC